MCHWLLSISFQAPVVSPSWQPEVFVCALLPEAKSFKYRYWQVIHRNELNVVNDGRPRWQTDDKICKKFLFRWCPHDLFHNTKSDLGACPLRHDERWGCLQNYTMHNIFSRRILSGLSISWCDSFCSLKETFEESDDNKYKAIFASELLAYCEQACSDLVCPIS